MLRNYLYIAFRNIRKQKGYSLINIAGLAVGMACFILIILYLQNEFSYDNFHEKKDNIHRIIQQQPGNIYIGSDYFAVTPARLAPALMEDFPEVEFATRIDDIGRGLLKKGDISFYEMGIYTDENFFDVFTFEMAEGEGKSALQEPFTIILSEKLAKKYFGDENPIGKTINFNEKNDLTVKGIHKEVPANSHFKFDYIISWKTKEADPNTLKNMSSWGNSSFYTYLVLSPGTNIENTLRKFTIYYKQKSEQPNSTRIWIIQHLKDIHLRSTFNFDMAERTDIKHLYLLSGIGLLILGIACINYMNLATARSSKRAREIGIRKVVGAKRVQLIRQFIGESVSFSVLSLSAAMLLVIILLPAFNNYVGKELSFNPVNNYTFFIFLICLTLSVGLIAGSYPALLLSSFKPVKVLRSSGFKMGGGALFRNILVIFQFTSTVVLIAGTLVINKQLQYLRDKDLGFNKDHVAVIRMRDQGLRDNFEVIRTELLRSPDILSVSYSNSLPSRISSNNGMKVENNEGEMTQQSIYVGSVDYDFINLYELELVKGRNFSKDFGTDPNHAVIVNEEMVKYMGWTDPIGKKVDFWSAKEGEVIGVLKNYHFYSLHEKIEPALLYLSTKYAYNASVKIRANSVSSAVGFIKNVVEKHSINHPFEYYFLDENYYENYVSEQKLGEIFIYFSSVAIFIACLGLFGLSAFTTERRTKEIGIRKTLGATETNLMVLLTKEFARFVIAATVIGVPLSYYFLHKWLTNFAYHADMGWIVFAAASIISMTVAMLTVGIQAKKAAAANPVETLRND
ncbi:ABC transporter permease [candidate division KSB1 bacterium]